MFGSKIWCKIPVEIDLNAKLINRKKKIQRNLYYLMLWTQFEDKQEKLGYFIEKSSQMLEKI